MARLPRITHHDGGFYHVYNRLSGPRHFYAFQDSRLREFFINRLYRYIKSYCCSLASFSLMGNHYHLILLIDRFRKLAREELEARAKIHYGDQWRKNTFGWSDNDWARFNERLFDLSDLMARFQSDVTRWYNDAFDSRGSIWAGRFQSTCLEDLPAAVQCLFYVELNPVRAKLVRKPDEWHSGSARLRSLGRDGHLMSLTELFPEVGPDRAYSDYRQQLLFHGTQPTARSAATIPGSVLERERRRGFARPGTYVRRIPIFSNGLALGSAQKIQHKLDLLYQRKLYRRRRNAVPQLGGLLYSLREPRKHLRMAS